MQITLGAFESAEMSENEKWKQQLQSRSSYLSITCLGVSHGDKAQLLPCACQRRNV